MVLQGAGNAVKRATEALVREAQNKTRKGLETGNDDMDAVVGASGVTVSVGGRMVTDMAKVRKMNLVYILHKQSYINFVHARLEQFILQQFCICTPRCSHEF
jgi:hypothetical protein